MIDLYLPPVGLRPRNPDFPAAERKFIAAHPLCFLCGKPSCTAHHTYPVHAYPELEMVEKWWRPVCPTGCHLRVCHAGDWSTWVDQPVLDHIARLARSGESAGHGWVELVANPYVRELMSKNTLGPQRPKGPSTVSKHKPHVLPDGRTVFLVNRDQMRRTRHGRTFAIPFHLAAIAARIPTPPTVVDWTKGDTINFPMLGNDREGDCYYVAILKQVIAWLANNGTSVSFDTAAVLRRYEQISGGDNGLADQDVFPEFMAGILGPNGPHKILGSLTIRPTDRASIKLAMWLFGPLLYTASLPDQWLNNAGPGATWDRASPDPQNGHAMLLARVNSDGTYADETWGFNPPIRLTPAGLEGSDAEVITCFSLEWFNPQTGFAPNGLHYADLAPLWAQLGGSTLPPSPFPAPSPNPDPGPGPGPNPDPGPFPMPLPAETVNFGFRWGTHQGSGTASYPDGSKTGTVTGTCSRTGTAKAGPAADESLVVGGGNQDPRKFALPPEFWMVLAKWGLEAGKFFLAEYKAGKNVKEILNDIEVLLFGFDPTPDNAAR